MGGPCGANGGRTRRPSTRPPRPPKAERAHLQLPQIYRVMSGLLRLWTRFPRLGPAQLLDAVLRVALDLLLSLLLNIELWFALRTGARLHWTTSLLLAAAALGLPALTSVFDRPPGGGRSVRLLALLGGESFAGTLPTLPYSHVSWQALAFWISLFVVHCAIVYCYIAGQLVVDTLSLLYSYFGRSLTGASGIGGAQLLVLLLCIWVPVVLFFLVSFSLTFTLWVMGVGLYRGAAQLRLQRERGLPDLLARHFDPAADRLERRFLHSPTARATGAASAQGPRGGSGGGGSDDDCVWAAQQEADQRNLPPTAGGRLFRPPETRPIDGQLSPRCDVVPAAHTLPTAGQLACSSSPPSPAVDSLAGSPGSSRTSSPGVRCSLGLLAAQLRPSMGHDPPRALEGLTTDAGAPPMGASTTQDASTRDAPRTATPGGEAGVSGAALLGRLPATGGWGFAQVWNGMLAEMRTEDLVSDAEVAALQFAMVPRHPLSPHEAPSQPLPPPASLPPPSSLPPPAPPEAVPLPLLIPPPLGSLKRALGQLLGGCRASSLPTLSRLSLAAACDIATRLTSSLLGPLHAADLAAASQALLAVLPPLLPHAPARHAPPDGTLPPALRSERVVRGLRKSLLALCDALVGMMLAHVAEGAEGDGAGARVQTEPVVMSASGVLAWDTEGGRGSAARPSLATLRGVISSASSLTQLRARALDASTYASVSLRELEKIRAQVRSRYAPPRARAA
eukprot:scaffold6764_cov115-Isochrysis_galbana.AAC.4